MTRAFLPAYYLNSYMNMVKMQIFPFSQNKSSLSPSTYRSNCCQRILLGYVSRVKINTPSLYKKLTSMTINIASHPEDLGVLQYHKHGVAPSLLYAVIQEDHNLIIPTLMDIEVFLSFPVTINTVMKILVHSLLCTHVKCLCRKDIPGMNWWARGKQVFLILPYIAKLKQFRLLPWLGVHIFSHPNQCFYYPSFVFAK